MTSLADAAVAFLVGQGCAVDLAEWTVHDAHVPRENIEALARAGGWQPGRTLPLPELGYVPPVRALGDDWDPPAFVQPKDDERRGHGPACGCYACTRYPEPSEDTAHYTIDGRARPMTGGIVYHPENVDSHTARRIERRWKRER